MKSLFRKIYTALESKDILLKSLMNSIKLYLFVFFTPFFINSCENNEKNIVGLSPEYSVSGYVNFPDGTPVNEITVFLTNQYDEVIRESITDGTGKYQISHISPANYKVYARLEGDLLDEMRFYCPEQEIEISNKDKILNILVGLQYPKIMETSNGGNPALFRTEELHIGNNSNLVEHILIKFSKNNYSGDLYKLYKISNDINWTEGNYGGINIGNFEYDEPINELNSTTLEFNFYSYQKIDNFLSCNNGWAVTPDPGECLLGNNSWEAGVIHIHYDFWNK